jgi:hypothetical protein
MTSLNTPPALATSQPTAPQSPGTRTVDPAECAFAGASQGSNGPGTPPLGVTPLASPNDVEGVLTRVRRLMLISSAFTLAAIVVVLSLVGYRVFGSRGYAPTDVVSPLPQGAKIVQTAVAEDRIIVILEIGGTIEIRTYDLHTLKPMGRLSFGFSP